MGSIRRRGASCLSLIPCRYFHFHAREALVSLKGTGSYSVSRFTAVNVLTEIPEEEEDGKEEPLLGPR